MAREWAYRYGFTLSTRSGSGVRWGGWEETKSSSPVDNIEINEDEVFLEANRRFHEPIYAGSVVSHRNFAEINYGKARKYYEAALYYIEQSKTKEHAAEVYHWLRLAIAPCGLAIKKSLEVGHEAVTIRQAGDSASLLEAINHLINSTPELKAEVTFESAAYLLNQYMISPAASHTRNAANALLEARDFYNQAEIVLATGRHKDEAIDWLQNTLTLSRLAIRIGSELGHEDSAAAAIIEASNLICKVNTLIQNSLSYRVIGGSLIGSSSPLTLKILFVDDDDNDRFFGHRALSRGVNGIEITEAENGEDALKKIKEQGPFVLVVTDLNMPHMNGRGLIRILREQNPELPIILHSDDPRLKEIAAELGVIPAAKSAPFETGIDPENELVKLVSGLLDRLSNSSSSLVNFSSAYLLASLGIKDDLDGSMIYGQPQESGHCGAKLKKIPSGRTFDICLNASYLPAP